MNHKGKEENQYPPGCKALMEWCAEGGNNSVYIYKIEVFQMSYMSSELHFKIIFSVQPSTDQMVYKSRVK